MTWLTRLTSGWKQFRNARLYRRVPTDVPVRVTSSLLNEVLEAKIRDWSPGGLFIYTDVSIPLEQIVLVEFPIGSQPGSLLRLSGQVVRHQKEADTGKFEGFGIMFNDFTESGLNVLREVLMRATSSLPPA